MFYEYAKREYDSINNRIISIESKLQTLPSGSLNCAGNGKYFKWYHSENGSNTYIPKANRPLAEMLATRKYLTFLLQELYAEKRAIQFYLDHHLIKSPSLNLLNHPAYANLLQSYFTPHSQAASEWMNAPFEHNTKHPENLIHKCISGNMVRSKSEVLIDTLLYRNHIPYRYECALHLGNTTIFPDFTIRHPNHETLYYWEHFGLMDNSTYSANAFSKMQLYNTHGITPSIQLITTFETKENPLSPDTIEKIISHYFL